MTPLVLGLLAVVLAGPVPWATAHLSVLRRTPVAALVWWQSVAVAAVLSALGAGVSLATSHWPPGPGWQDTVVAAVALVVTLTVLGRLVLTGHRVGTELRSLRRHHLERVALLGRARPDGVMVLDHPVPVAYCIPVLGHSSVVLSGGAVERLDTEQLAAVVAHERAHLSSRHDLLLEAFTVLDRAFPRFVGGGTARREVSLLVEVLADRAATRRVGARALASALLEVAGGRVPAGVPGAAGSDDAGGVPVERLTVRARLLGDPHQHLLQAVALVGASVALIATPTVLVVLPWLRDLG